MKTTNGISLTMLATLLCLLPVPTRAETAVQAWVQSYNGPWNGGDSVTAVVVDGGNNVIVTGESSATGSDYDWATIKYSSTGMPLWTNRYNGPGNGDDNPFAMAVDGSNNVIVTGNSYSIDYTDSEFVTVKYSSAGLPLWTNRYNGPGNGGDYANAVAVDGSNNVIVTGPSTGSEGDYDYATIKYSSDGVPLWTNCCNGTGNYEDGASAVAVDRSNNVIVTGQSANAKYSATYSCCLTIKYSSAGVPLWTNRYNGPGNYNDFANAVAVDDSNNVIVAGGSTGNTGWLDYLTIKYSSAGIPLWTNCFNGTPEDVSEMAMTLDGSNNVIVTGFVKGSGSVTNYYDWATIKYSSTGVLLWTNYYNGPGNSYDYARAVAVDRRDNVIVTGQSLSSSGGNNGVDFDYATIKYSSAGVPLWTNRYAGPRNSYDCARAVAVDGSGNVIVAGFSSNGTNDDFLTIKYICVRSPLVTGLQPANGAFQLRVDDVLQPGTLVIEASTNLAGWAPVFTNTTPTNVLFYTDPEAGNNPRRFYRAFQFP